MSIDNCEVCGKRVNTDTDDQCYGEDGAGSCLCPVHRERDEADEPADVDTAQVPLIRMMEKQAC